MILKDVYNFDNEKYGKLRDASVAVNRAYLDANRFLDFAKEYVYIEQGMPNFSEITHRQAHKALEKLDEFGDLLHEQHLMQIYPDTPFLDWRAEFKDVDSVFEFIIRTLENVQEALEKFRAATDNAEFRAMALKTEELMLDNSGDYTKFLEMGFRWQNDGGSKTSFDSWCKRYLEGDNG